MKLIYHESFLAVGFTFQGLGKLRDPVPPRIIKLHCAAVIPVDLHPYGLLPLRCTLWPYTQSETYTFSIEESTYIEHSVYW